jgi:hypothetical protein
MLVSDISISQYRYCPVSARHMAKVCMTLKNQIVTLFCQLDLPEDESNTKRAAAFVGDAIRQLGKMPEHHTGRKIRAVANINRATPMYFA